MDRLITPKVIDAFNAVSTTEIPLIRQHGSHENFSNWKILFTCYNDHHEESLSMGCYPCYHKVYQFVKEQYEAGSL
jgi:hypothetical protein